MSPLLLSELRDVFRREKFRPCLTQAEADDYVEQLQRAYLIGLARAAGASALVSGDAHSFEE